VYFQEEILKMQKRIDSIKTKLELLMWQFWVKLNLIFHNITCNIKMSIWIWFFFMIFANFFCGTLIYVNLRFFGTFLSWKNVTVNMNTHTMNNPSSWCNIQKFQKFKQF
jgi:hypothetical protein